MSDAFEEYHRVTCGDGTEKIVFMSWGSYWDEVLGKLMRGPMLRLEVHDVSPEYSPKRVSPLNTGETWRDYNNDEKRKEMIAEWLKRERL